MIRRLALGLVLLAACSRPGGDRPPEELGPAAAEDIRRIVTLAPSLTDLVLAIGAGDRLVGVTRFDDAPEVANLPRVGGYSDPSPETILKLRTDLVLCQPSPGNKGAVRLLADEGIPVHVFTLETLDEVEASTTRLGALVGRKAEAELLVSRLRAGRAAARRVAQERARKVRAVILYGVDPLVAAGPGSFAHELLVDAGGDNVAAASTQPFPRLSVERLVAGAPDVVLLAGFDQHGASRDALPPLNARIVSLRSAGFLRPGPGVVEALEELSSLFDDLSNTSAQTGATR